MNQLNSNSPVAVLLSGGLDSAVLAGRLAAEYPQVHPLYIQGGLLWEAQEQAAVERFLARIAGPSLGTLTVLALPLGDLYAGHWSLDGRATPGAGTPDEAVYLPGRNPLLLVKAVVWCHLQEIRQLALAPLEANPFGDATDEFFAEFEGAMTRALGWAPRIVRPFAKLSKPDVVRLGRHLPLELTFSCIHPVAGLHCGRCNKCEERQIAFRVAEVADLTPYAIET